MKLNYYRDTDSLYIELNSNSSVETKEIAEGLLIDFDKHGNIVGIDIDHASKKMNLKILETKALPFTKTKIA